MAQTKRKTKHRGNAAGVVESRGRTGRPPTAAERSAAAREKQAKRAARENRYDRPPTWKSAFYRALLAAFIMTAACVFLVKSTALVVVSFPLALVLYVPVSYYSDMWMYRRRMRSKRAQGADSR
jgi:Flp pilus assembly protein TadB